MKWKTIRQMPTLEKAFEELRRSDAHVGMGDIRLTIDEQESLCNVAKNQFFNQSTRCHQLLSFCAWIVREKGGRIEEGKEEETVWEWTRRT